GDRAEGEQRGQFGGDLTLRLSPRAEALAAADIDDEQQRQLALLDEALDERMAHAGGDVPVDAADIVARLVLAHLFECYAAPLEDAAIGPAEQILDGPAGPQLQSPHLAAKIAREHRLSSYQDVCRLRLSVPSDRLQAVLPCGDEVPRPAEAGHYEQ